MKILVLVKQVPDPNAIRFDADGNFSANTPRVINENDQYALEESVQLKEADSEVDITVACVGPDAAKDAVSRGLAMGADRGLLIEVDGNALGSLAIAQVLRQVVEAGDYDLVLMGQESSDSGAGNVGPQLGALTGLPFVSNVVDLQVSGSALRVQREVEDGRHVVDVDLPVIICALTGLNEPRYPSLKGIMAARRKPVDVQPITAFDVDADPLRWGGLREEVDTVEGVTIEGEAEDAAREVVRLLQERDLI